MKYYIIAGEASGDVHGANLISSIKKIDSEAEFRGWGGDLMKNEGLNLVKHYKETAYMGIIEVVLHLKSILKNIAFCKKDIMKYNPDSVILIDYPGFNFKIAKFAKKNGFKTLYYIAPKIWAWKQSRIKRIKRDIDKVFSILPFEVEFYKKFKYDKLEYIGNPLLDNIDKFKKQNNISNAEFIKMNNLSSKPIVAILCGSRKQEVNTLLPTILKVTDQYEDFQFIIAGLSSLDEEIYIKNTKNHNVKVIYDQTYKILEQSCNAIVASGTASLETALFNVPHVVAYKMMGGILATYIWKNIIKIKFASLVNLILDKEAVKELIQGDFNVKNLKIEVEKLFYNNEYRQNIITDYSRLNKLIGKVGASDKAAKIIVQDTRS